MENDNMYVKIELTESGFILSGNVPQESLSFLLQAVAEEIEATDLEIETGERDEVGKLH